IRVNVVPNCLLMQVLLLDALLFVSMLILHQYCRLDCVIVVEGLQCYSCEPLLDGSGCISSAMRHEICIRPTMKCGVLVVFDGKSLPLPRAGMLVNTNLLSNLDNRGDSTVFAKQ